MGGSSRETSGKRRGELKRAVRALVALSADDAFVDAFVEAGQDSGVQSELMANPKAHLQGKRVRIPREMSVEAIEGPPWGLRLSFARSDDAQAGIEITSGAKGPETDPGDRGRLRRLSNDAVDMLASDAVLDSLEEVASDDAARATAKANPKAYLRGKGITVSDEIDIELREGSYCYHICFRYWNFIFCGWICW